MSLAVSPVMARRLPPSMARSEVRDGCARFAPHRDVAGDVSAFGSDWILVRTEAIVEAVGPVPEQITPVKIVGVKVLLDMNRSKMKEHMRYCVSYPEVKGVMMEGMEDLVVPPVMIDYVTRVLHDYGGFEAETSEREESALISENYEEKVTELPSNKAKQLETSSLVAETVNTPLETGKSTEESGIFSQALSVPMVIADEHSNMPESCKAAKQTESEEEAVENEEKAIESEVCKEDAPEKAESEVGSELFDSVVPSKKEAISILEKNQGDSNGVTSSQDAKCEDIKETPAEQHVTTVTDFKEQDLNETRRELVKEETEDKNVDAQEASEQCEIVSEDIEEQKSEESVKKTEQDEEIEEIKLDVETEKREQNGLLQAVTSDAYISTQTMSEVETTEHEQKDEDVNVLEECQDKDDIASTQEVTFEGDLQEKNHHSEDKEHEIVGAKGSIEEDADVISTQKEVVKESIKNEEPDDGKAIEKEVCEENDPKKAELGEGLEIYDSAAPSQKETLNMLEKNQGDGDGVTSSQEAPCVDVEETTTVQHVTTVIDFKEPDLNEKVREFIKEETEDKSLDAQEASKECEKGVKEEIEQEPEESVKKIEEEEEIVTNDVNISAQTKSQVEKIEHEEEEKSDGLTIKEECETDSEKVVHEHAVNKAAIVIINKDEEKEQEVNVLEKDEGVDDVTSTENVTFEKDLLEKNRHNEDEESEIVTAEEIIEKDTEVIISNEKTEEQMLLNSIPSDVCISAQPEPDEESTEKNDEEAIENDDGLTNENVLEKTETEGLKLSDSSSMALNENETARKDEDQGKQQDIYVSEEGRNGGDDVISSESASNKDIKETTTHQHETTVADFETGQDLSATHREILIEKAMEKSVDAQEEIAQYDDGAKGEIEQNLEESVNETDSYSRNEQEEYTEEIKPSVKTIEEKDVCISTQIESQEEATKNEEYDNENDGDHKEKLDNLLVDGVFEESDLKKTETEAAIQLSDGSKVKTRESVDADTEETKSSDETKESEEQQGFLHAITSYFFSSTQTEDEGNNDEEIIENDGGQTEKPESQVEVVCIATSSEMAEYEEGMKHSDSFSTTPNENETLSKEEKMEKEEEIKTSEVQGGGSDVTGLHNASNEEIQDTTIGQRDTVVTYGEEGQGVSAIPKEILTEEAEDKSVDAQEISLELGQPDEQNVGDTHPCLSNISENPEDEIKKEEKDLSHESVEDTSDDTTKQEKRTLEQETVEELSEQGDVSRETVIDSNETTEVEPQENITPTNPVETATKDTSKSDMEKAESENLPIEDLETVSEVQIPELVAKLEDSVPKEECSISETETNLDEEKETVAKEISSDEKIEVQHGGDDVTNSQNASSEDIQETTIDQHDTTVAYVEEGQSVSAMPKEILKEEAEDKSIDADEISLELRQTNEQNVKETQPCLSETISENPEDENKIEDEDLSHESVEDIHDDTTREEKCTLEQQPMEEHSNQDDASKEIITDLKETTEVEPQEDIKSSTLVETSTEDISISEKDKADSENLPIEDLKAVSEVQIPELVSKSEESGLKEECFISEAETHVDEEKKIVTKEISSDEKTERTAEIKHVTVKEVCEETSSEKAEFEEGLKLSDGSDMKINEEAITTLKDDDQEKDHEVNMPAESQGENSITSLQDDVYEEKEDLQDHDFTKSREGVTEDTEEIKSSVETKENTEDVIATNVCSSTQIQPEEETIENEEENGEKAVEYEENEIVSREENIEKNSDDVEETKMGEHATTVAYYEEGHSLGTVTKVLGEEEGDKSVVAQEETKRYEDVANDETEQKPEEHTNEIKTSVETNEEKDEEHAIESESDQHEKSDNLFVNEVCEKNDLKTIEYEEERQVSDSSNVKTRESVHEGAEETKSSDEIKENMEQQDIITTDVCSSMQTEYIEKTTEGEEKSDEETIENDDGQKEKPESPLVEVLQEETSSEMAEPEKGIKHSDSLSTTLNENETLSKEEKLEREDEIITSEVQGGGDNVTSSQNASTEEIIETTIEEHDTAAAYVEKGQGVGTITQEVLIVAEDKSFDVEEMSLELGKPNEQNVEDTNPCLSETISENPEDGIKKEDKHLSPEGVEDANDDTTKEEKCKLEQEPIEEHSDQDEVSKEEGTSLNETTELEPKENITPYNPLKTSTEATSNSEKEKEESKNLPIEELETVSEVHIPELEPKSEESMLKEECFISETETHLDEEKDTVTTEISSDEQKDQTSEIKQETVKEICEETSLEKAEFEEGLKLSDDSNIEITDKGITSSKYDDQEVNMSAESQVEDNITNSQNEVSEEKEDLQEKNYHSEGNAGDFTKSGEGVDEDTEEIKSSVETKENTEHVITTNVCSSTKTEPDEQTIEKEEKNSERAIEDDQIESVSREGNLEKKQEEPKEETIYNEEKNEEVIAKEADDKSVHAQEVSEELAQTKLENVEIQACLTETIHEKREDNITKKDEDLSYDSIEHINESISEEKCFPDEITKKIEISKLEHEPLEEQNDSPDEVTKENLGNLNETSVEPQEDVTPSSSLETSTEDTSNSEAKAESESLPIGDLESVSEVHIPDVMPRSEDSKVKEECLTSGTVTCADEENRIVAKEISSDENLETHGSTQQPENSYRTTEENVTQLEQISEINSLYENRDMKENVTQESQPISIEDCSEMVKDVILTEKVPLETEAEMRMNDFKKQIVQEDSYSTELEEGSAPDQKEMISYSESIPVGNPEVTEVNVDAQIGQEDSQGKEHISCVSKVINEVDQEPKEETVASLEESTTIASPVDLSNIESTAYPSKVTTEVDQEPQALESDIDVHIPVVVADSEDSKEKEECIVFTTAENTNENNVEEQDAKTSEISSAADTEHEHVPKAPTKSDEAKSSELITEEKALTIENLEIHGEFKPTSDLVIEEDQVTTETKPQPEQSEITSENMTSDHTLESKLEHMSSKDLEDAKEDVTLAPQNEIKIIEDQNETTNNIILTDEVAVETERENERNETGQVSEDSICPTKVDNTSSPNQKELANEVLLEDEKANESQSIEDIINEEAKQPKLNQLISNTDDLVLSSTEQDIEVRSEESMGHDDMLKLEEKPTEDSEIAAKVDEIVPECGEASATDVKIREKGELVNCDSQEPSEDNTLLSQSDKNTEEPDVLSSVEKDVINGVDERSEEALIIDVQKHEKDLDHEPEVRIADVVSNVESPEIEPPCLHTKEAPSEFIKQEDQREQKKADDSIEAVIPVEDVKTSTRDLEVPSAMDATADKPNNKTVEVHEAGKELLKDSESHESTFDLSKPVEESSGLKQEPLEVDAPEILGTTATKDLKISQKYVTDDLIKESQTHPEIQKYEAPAYTVDKQQSPNEPHPKENKTLTEKIGSSYEQGEPIAESSIPEASNLKVDKASGTDTQSSKTFFIDQKEKSESVEPAKFKMDDVLHEPAKGNSEAAKNLTGEKDSGLTKDQQVDKEEIGESGVKTEEEYEDEDEDNEDDEKMGSISDAPVMVEASKDMEVKAHKKSHNILSGVGSKVKHSIAKFD
ncbi:hypothetical protein SSX86_014647 [Deinandra increscens subsp. villosa]|uniref:Uncharacterized protein n=1 Tax=Deinandra increscens subsp. villosa TaxID=3103831 RepID=A0AAP0GZK5_9ASTR